MHLILVHNNIVHLFMLGRLGGLLVGVVILAACL